LEQLKGRYGETIDVAESAELAKAFGTKEASGMIKLLMADTNGLAQSVEQLGNIQGMGKAEDMAAKMTDQWERLEAVWFAVRASVFGAILPALNSVVGLMVDGLSVIVSWVDEFPLLGEILGWVAIGAITLGAVVASLSLAMGIGQMMSAGWALTMGTLSGVFKALRISTMLMTASTWLFSAALWANPITWIVAGIIALGVAIGAAIYYWDDIKATFADSAVFKFLGETIDWVIDKLNMIPGIDIDVSADMPATPELEVAKQSVQVTPELETMANIGTISPEMTAANQSQQNVIPFPAGVAIANQATKVNEAPMESSLMS